MGVPLRNRYDHLVWRVLGLLPLPTRRRLAYRRAHHRPLSLDAPETFTEKINWRMVRDRRPWIGEMCDKLRSKEMAAERLPDLRTAQVLWVGTDVADFARRTLPERWVLKPNHRTGLVHLGVGTPDAAALQRRTRRWLEEPQHTRLGEWGYSVARRLLLAEEWLGEPGTTPDDFKIFCFDGRPMLIQRDINRFSGHRRHFLAPDGTPMRVSSGFDDTEPPPPPADLERMLDVASTLSKGYDFVRVDLYDVAGELYFGEYTVYPGGGLDPFEPASFDRDFGRHWVLPDLTGAATVRS
jgi:hypothetical protein